MFLYLISVYDVFILISVYDDFILIRKHHYLQKILWPVLAFFFYLIIINSYKIEIIIKSIYVSYYNKQ